MQIMEAQSATDLFMIRPASFQSNQQTHSSNRFQQQCFDTKNVQTLACAEFDILADALTQAGIRVNLFSDTPIPTTPDALFPNNWVSFHADGTVVLYPMLAPNRRAERRQDIIDELAANRGYSISRV